MSQISDLKDSLDTLLYDPTRVQGIVLDTVEAASDGRLQYFDPTQPAVQAMEVAAVLASVVDRRDELRVRRLYAAVAQTYDDLYYHMSDVDYLDRFSTPLTIPFTLAFKKNDILAKAVQVNGSGTKKLIIPRNTVFTVEGMDFTLQYPIEIRVLSYGALQIVYDTTVTNPIQKIESNVITWSYSRFPGVDDTYLYIRLPVPQLRRTDFTESLNPATGFVKTYTLSDQFHYCRVFSYQSGQLIELQTTHSQVVYDIAKPTATLKVTERQLRVEIPQIYLTNGLVEDSIIIYVYTSKGELSVNMPDYSSSAFTRRLGNDYNLPTDSVYTAPLESMDWLQFSDATAVGGSNGLSFEELKYRVITNSGVTNIPITDTQLRAGLSLRGYDVLKSVDDLLKRVYLATRNLPAPVGVNQNFSTGAGCAIDTLEATMSQLSSLSVVEDNGDRITLLPTALYKYDSGKLFILSDQERTTLLGTPKDALVSLVNSGRYAFTPFHYVLDATNESFKCRPYYLDGPTVSERQFIQQNPTAEWTVALSDVFVEKIPTGYRILLTTITNDTYKDLDLAQLHCQLAYRPNNEVNYTYLNGNAVWVGEDYAWELFIETNHDVDAQEQIQLTNFVMFANEDRNFGAALAQTFEIIFSVSDVITTGVGQTEIDTLLGLHLLPEDVTLVGLTHDQVTLKLGDSLDSLWSNSRSVASSKKYLTYTTDVIRTYTERVYERDPTTGFPVFTQTPEGGIEFTVLHEIGDPVIINGEQQYIYRAGDVTIDPTTGEPIVIEERTITRQIDLLLIDGLYYFVTATADVGYKDSIPASIVGYLRNDLDVLRGNLLENTELYLYPKRSLGDNTVTTLNGVRTTLPAGLSFSVTFFMTRSKYSDLVLRESMAEETSRVINTVLQRSTVSIAAITKELQEAIGDDIVSVEVAPVGPLRDISTFTALDESIRCVVKRVLRVAPDDTLVADEDIAIGYVLHVED